jgi:hypothetical protein
MGVDIEKLLYRALEMQRACEASVVPQQNPGVWLGTILATLAQHGHDKITLVASPGIDTFGYWAEQLLAESTGKEGKGLIPIEGEPLGATKRYGADRLFVYLRLEGAKNDALDKKIAALEKAGQPVVRLRLDDKFDLGAEFFRWEFATAVAGALMQIDAFDQPNVQESKENTKRVLVERRSVGKALYQDNHVAVFSNEKVRGAKNLRGIFEAFLQNTRGGEYLALMAYLARTSANARELQKMRVVARDALGVATTVGFGPRFLHSTGQLHKGGPNSGVFIQITADAEQDAKIPGEKFSFGTLIRAQALGDYESLVAHQRRVLRVHLKNGASLGIVVKAFKDALKKRR